MGCRVLRTVRNPLDLYECPGANALSGVNARSCGGVQVWNEPPSTLTRVLVVSLTGGGVSLLAGGSEGTEPHGIVRVVRAKA